MNSQSKGKTLLERIRQGLSVCASQQTKKNLGERKSYIGMSDLARYAECPLAAIAAKIKGKEERLKDLITLQRGHWYERGIGEALEAVAPSFIQQLEISAQIGAAPVKAHLDFTHVWDRPLPVVQVLEIKSTGALPENPYDAHRFQIQGQISLLSHHWNEPVFSADGASSKPMTFPNLCANKLGLSMPEDTSNVSIEGWLVYLSLQDAKVFGPYAPEKAMLESISTLADAFWRDQESYMAHPENLSMLEYSKGFHPFCNTCDANSGCPKFRDRDNAPQWEDALDKLDRLKAQRSTIDGEIREIEDCLKQVCRGSSHRDWFLTGRHRFRMTPVNGRQSLDATLLREELESLFECHEIEDIADDFLKRCTKVGAPTERLTVKPVNSGGKDGIQI